MAAPWLREPSESGSVQSIADDLLPDNTDLLRELDAHIGHAYTTIAADILVRHQRQRGQDTFFLTGVDEHASKVARVAEEQGLTPQEYADRIAVTWRALPQQVGASHDFFIRTSR